MHKINLYICTFIFILDIHVPNTVMDRAQVMERKNENLWKHLELEIRSYLCFKNTYPRNCVASHASLETDKLGD